MDEQTPLQPQVPTAVPPGYLAVTADCFEDPAWPGLCHQHEVYHLANGNDLDECRGEIPRRV